MLHALSVIKMLMIDKLKPQTLKTTPICHLTMLLSMATGGRHARGESESVGKDRAQAHARACVHVPVVYA